MQNQKENLYIITEIVRVSNGLTASNISSSVAQHFISTICPTEKVSRIDHPFIFQPFQFSFLIFPNQAVHEGDFEVADDPQCGGHQNVWLVHKPSSSGLTRTGRLVT